uniref:NADH-ubiquinone oxidoreductase chain 4L n=1 Tax=Bostrichoidea sp. 4 KM-2017 TaxID=2219278 RepID=A0A346RIJ0_9COLE|nr:NADH dehydrogenase subunit 4L [Bostrichoidea sp. 4 KM-2017]
MLMFFSMMYFFGLISFVLKRKHLLLMFLSLEFIVIILYFGLCLYFNMFLYENFFLMIFLTFSVCESALGLSILVLMIRYYGNDYFNSFNLLW